MSGSLSQACQHCTWQRKKVSPLLHSPCKIHWGKVHGKLFFQVCMCAFLSTHPFKNDPILSNPRLLRFITKTKQNKNCGTTDSLKPFKRLRGRQRSPQYISEHVLCPTQSPLLPPADSSGGLIAPLPCPVCVSLPPHLS